MNLLSPALISDRAQLLDKLNRVVWVIDYHCAESGEGFGANSDREPRAIRAWTPGSILSITAGATAAGSKPIRFTASCRCHKLRKLSPRA